jgi:2-succinyl-5-enolpyruvyl-6-hydroxy-3-cyclohexene-1-carboxylate synthase
VSGIDGCLSAACGAAHAGKRITTIILGDLGFVYDSNALWNKRLSPHMRIVVINNQGGGIFRLLSGTQQLQSFEEFINAYHPVNVRDLASAFGLSYYFCDELTDLQNVMTKFYNMEQRAKILEIRTSPDKNDQVYQSYLKIVGQ